MPKLSSRATASPISLPAPRPSAHWSLAAQCCVGQVLSSTGMAMGQRWTKGMTEVYEQSYLEGLDQGWRS